MPTRVQISTETRVQNHTETNSWLSVEINKSPSETAFYFYLRTKVLKFKAWGRNDFCEDDRWRPPTPGERRSCPELRLCLRKASPSACACSFKKLPGFRGRHVIPRLLW